MVLGDTNLQVSRLCLGGNVFGWSLDEARSFEVLDAYAQAGGNFIDTADLYGRAGDGEGASERIIGRWMAARGNREQIVIATKVGMGQEHPGLSAQNIAAAARASLERLAVETIDLYYAHRDDEQTPLQETLEAFTALVQDGSVRHIAASNYSARRLSDALSVSRTHGLAAYDALQPHYNLLERAEYEGPLAAVCAEHGLPCIPFFGLARGFLTGKYRRGAPAPDSPRAAGVLDAYANERGFRVLDALEHVAGGRGAPIAAVALAWLMAQPTVLAPIASATSPAQLAELMGSIELELDAGELGLLASASA